MGTNLLTDIHVPVFSIMEQCWTPAIYRSDARHFLPRTKFHFSLTCGTNNIPIFQLILPQNNWMSKLQKTFTSNKGMPWGGYRVLMNRFTIYTCVMFDIWRPILWPKIWGLNITWGIFLEKWKILGRLSLGFGFHNNGSQQRSISFHSSRQTFFFFFFFFCGIKIINKCFVFMLEKCKLLGQG